MRFGVVPAGGKGTRMKMMGMSKELLPVGGIPVIEYILQRMVHAGIKNIFVTTHEDKADLNYYLTNKSPNREVVTLMSRERQGLSDGILAPAANFDDNDLLYFGLPDTIWYPTNGFTTIDRYQEDLVLGLLPSITPELYGSVEIGKDYFINKITEKPRDPESPWIWAFGRIAVKIIPELMDTGKSSGEEKVFTEILGEYCKTHRSRGVTFDDGSYLDIGIPENYQIADSFIV